MKNKSFYLETYGCQMNLHDSEHLAGIMEQSGFTRCLIPDQAGVILLNTCSVREHAENRVISRIKQLHGKLESSNQNGSGKRIYGICGCMPRIHGEKLYEIMPFLDLLAGPDSFRKLPYLIEQLNMKGVKEKDLVIEKNNPYEGNIPSRDSRFQAWVEIMRGCNGKCAYCVVPAARGQEKSRPLNEIKEEVQCISEQGVLEVTLLGQKVNAYNCNGANFSRLLRELDQIKGIDRIRFTTSHPAFMTDELISTIRDCKSVCEHVHLPVQSGSNNILKSMHRNYTREKYLSVIEMLRKKIPEISLSTDILVGFPGETDDDFKETLSILKEVRYDHSFMFRYSERPGTSACLLKDSIPDQDKLRRLAEVIELQMSITREKIQECSGQVLEILVQGKSKKSPGELFGKSRTNKVVVFPGSEEMIGKLLKVKVYEVSGHTLKGFPEHTDKINKKTAIASSLDMISINADRV